MIIDFVFSLGLELANRYLEQMHMYYNHQLYLIKNGHAFVMVYGLFFIVD